MMAQEHRENNIKKISVFSLCCYVYDIMFPFCCCFVHIKHQCKLCFALARPRHYVTSLSQAYMYICNSLGLPFITNVLLMLIVKLVWAL